MAQSLTAAYFSNFTTNYANDSLKSENSVFCQIIQTPHIFFFKINELPSGH